MGLLDDVTSTVSACGGLGSPGDTWGEVASHLATMCGVDALGLHVVEGSSPEAAVNNMLTSRVKYAAAQLSAALKASDEHTPHADALPPAGGVLPTISAVPLQHPDYWVASVDAAAYEFLVASCLAP